MSKGKVIGLYHSGSDTVRISSQTAKTRIDGTNIKLDAPITASSNISASGKIITSVVDLLGGNLLTLGDIDGSNAGVRIELNQSTNKVEVKNADLVVGVADSNHQSLFVTSDITASGNLEVAGNIMGNIDGGSF